MYVAMCNVVHVASFVKNHFGDFFCQAFLIVSTFVNLLDVLQVLVYSNNRECDTNDLSLY